MGQAKVKQARSRARAAAAPALGSTEEMAEAVLAQDEPSVEVAKEATGEELGPDQDWEFVTLPVLGVKVRVRYLPTHEIGSLAGAPDLLNFRVIAIRIQEQLVALEQGKEDERSAEEKQQESETWAKENTRYMAHLSHLAIMHPQAPENDMLCHSCEFPHRRSLYTVRQATRFHQADVNAVATVALKAQAVARLRPFSTARLASPSESDASSTT